MNSDRNVILAGLAYIGLCGVIWAGFTLWNRVDTALKQIDRLDTAAAPRITGVRPAKDG